MQLKFSHLAENAFQSQTGQLNLIQIFDTLSSPVIPFAFPRPFLTIGIEVQTPDEFESLDQTSVGVKLRNPEGLQMFQIQIRLNSAMASAERPIIQLLAPFDQLVITTYGLHLFEITINDEPIGETRLLVGQPG